MSEKGARMSEQGARMSEKGARMSEQGAKSPHLDIEIVADFQHKQ